MCKYEGDEHFGVRRISVTLFDVIVRVVVYESHQFFDTKEYFRMKDEFDYRAAK